MAQVAERFFEKKTNKDQVPQIICWRTGPIWDSEASTVRDMDVLGYG